MTWSFDDEPPRRSGHLRPRHHDGQARDQGTRIPVELILRHFSASDSEQHMLADHPRLTIEDIRAAQTDDFF